VRRLIRPAVTHWQFGLVVVAALAVRQSLARRRAGAAVPPDSAVQ